MRELQNTNSFSLIINFITDFNLRNKICVPKRDEGEPQRKNKQPHITSYLQAAQKIQFLYFLSETTVQPYLEDLS